MTKQAVIRLNTLRCLSERDSAFSTGSEPYVWGFLIGIGSNPLSLDTTPDFPILSESRNIIKNNMKAGEVATIDFPGNLFTQSFADDQTGCQLVLIVALMEADELTDSAMQDGYQAFVDELRAQVPNILGLAGLSEEDQKQAMKPIIEKVKTQVFAGVESGLSFTEKAKIATGFTDKDDYLAAAFKHFTSIEALTGPSAFTLRLTGAPIRVGLGGSGFGSLGFTYINDYEIAAELNVTRLQVDPCQSKIDAVAAAEGRLTGLLKQIGSLKNSMQSASPQQKVAIQNQIEKIEAELIPAAQQGLARAQQTLRRCRIFGGDDHSINRSINQPIVEPM